MKEMSVLITTKDRVADLERALESIMAQTLDPELVIVDDGSTDGTSEFVMRYHPDAVLVRNESPLGIIAARNQGIRAATGEFVFTLDDDAVLSASDTLARVVSLFDEPRIGVVDLPVVDVIDGVEREVRWPRVSDGVVVCTGSFGGGSCAIRRAVFDLLGGYSGIDRQGEESDFGLRMLDLGRVVRAAPRELMIRHYPKHKARLKGYIFASAARNRILSVWRRSPVLIMPFETAAVAANHARLGVASGNFRAVASGLLDGVRVSYAMGLPRDPVRFKTFRVYRRLVRRGPLSLREIEDSLGKTRF